jgi:hypothetical protein
VREGLYRVRFRTPRDEDEGSGVVMLRDGRFLGGDSAMAYTGHYRVADDQLTADILVATHTFVPWMGPVLLSERARIRLAGPIEGDRITIGGEAETPSRTRLDVEMELIEAWDGP